MTEHLRKFEELRRAQGLIAVPFKCASPVEIAREALLVVDAVSAVPQLEPATRETYLAGVREVLADLQYHAKHQQFRRPDVWLVDEQKRA